MPSSRTTAIKMPTGAFGGADKPCTCLGISPKFQRSLANCPQIAYKEDVAWRWREHPVEVILIEVLLWAGLIFFFWALRDGLNRIESELEAQTALGATPDSRPPGTQFDRADKLSEPIGRYRDALIYRFAIIDGLRYQFMHVLPSESLPSPQTGQRCLAPGLVYSRCEEAPQLS
jgi:hypothetical protein